MIGMMVGGDHPRHPDRGEQRLPDIAADRRVEAGVDDRRPRSLSVMVVEQPEVDVIEADRQRHAQPAHAGRDFMRMRSEEHTSELQSLMRISYAVFCLKKKKKQTSR